MKDVHIHSVQDDELMRQLGVVTKGALHRTLLLQLKSAGRKAMGRFLTDHRDDIGHHSSTDLRAMFS